MGDGSDSLYQGLCGRSSRKGGMGMGVLLARMSLYLFIFSKERQEVEGTPRSWAPVVFCLARCLRLG